MKKQVSEDSVSEPPLGKRDIIQLIKYRASATPNASYGAIARDENDMSKGFEEISWSRFNNAIDRATHWLRKVLPEPLEPFETIGYTGPRDIRYPILIAAAAQLERKLLVPGPRLILAAQELLVEKTRCKFWLFAPPFEDVVRTVANKKFDWDLDVLEVPDSDFFLDPEKVVDVEWKKTWEESKDTPCVVVHTSGSTGLPKPAVWTHQALMLLDAGKLMPEYSADTCCVENHLAGRRWYCPMPMLHIQGVRMALAAPVCLGSTIVFGPSVGVQPANVQLCVDIIRHGKCNAVSFSPMFLDEFIKTPTALKTLEHLDFIYISGSPCSRSIIKELHSHNIRPVSLFGTTETGTLASEAEPGDDTTDYQKLRPSYGCVFEHRDGVAYEMVQYRKPEFERWQVVFMLFPHLDRFPFGDLYVESKTKPGHWKIIGRTDDWIILKSSAKLNAVDVELRFASSPGVTGVLVGGRGQAKPFLLVEWEDSTVDDGEKLAKLWPEVERVNGTLSLSIQLQRDLVLFTKGEKPLLRNIKGVPVRSTCEALYRDEIEQMYASATKLVY